MSNEAALKARWARYYANPLRGFWDRMDRSGGPDSCWVWQGPTKRRGYGYVMHKRKAYGAHRIALAGSIDALPEKTILACHRCDNPPCCNPKHLFWGSNTDNRRDAMSKGRANGFPRKIDRDKLKQLRAQGLTYPQLAAVFSVNPTSIARALRAIRDTQS